MCADPFTMAQIGLTIAGGAAQYGSQVQAAKAQAAAQRRASALEIRRNQQSMSAERLRESQEDTARAAERHKAQREADEIRATGITAGEEAGVSGNAVGLAVAEVDRANADLQSMLSLQERMDDASRSMAFEGTGMAFLQNMQRINKPIQQPDLLGTLIGTTQSAMGAYQTGQMRALQSDTMQLQNQLSDSRLATQRAQLGVARQRTLNERASLSLIQASTRTQEAQRRLYDASALRINQ